MDRVIEKMWDLGSQPEGTVSLFVWMGNTELDFCSGENDRQTPRSNPVTRSPERPNNGPITPPDTTQRRDKRGRDEGYVGMSPSVRGYKKLREGSCDTIGTYREEESY